MAPTIAADRGGDGAAPRHPAGAAVGGAVPFHRSEAAVGGAVPYNRSEAPVTGGARDCILLVLNLGSSSLKAASYALPADREDAAPDVGGGGARETGRGSAEPGHDPSATLDDTAGRLLAEIAAQLPSLHDAPDVVAHRIVHGGDRSGPVELTTAAQDALARLSSLAPLHQPPALALVRAAIARWPAARQVGLFDTSWHRTMPPLHRVLPIDHALYARGVKRYGFHGLAFQSAMRQLGQCAPELARSRIVLAHLGGGSSLCAVRDGAAVNTTMGMTPLGGIPMATRCGSLDPGVVLHLQRELGLSPDAIDRLLWRDSGLKGLSGESGDMRVLLASGSAGAQRAVDVYVSGIVQGIAAMAACIGGIDALVFSGGIGAHAALVRERVVTGLEWLGLGIDPGLNQSGAVAIGSAVATVRTFVLAIDEAGEMARMVADARL